MAEPRIVDISGIIEPFKERVATLRAKAAANPYALDAAIMINECLNDLERLPVIKSEFVKLGRWIKRKSIYAEGGVSAKCSVCQNDVQYLGNPLKYCPNCGAKMDEEGE